MKTLVKILLILILSSISCLNSPEKKILRDVKSKNYLKLKIESAQITDTLYKQQIKDKLDEIPLRIQNHQKMIQNYRHDIDSIRKINIDNNKSDSTIFNLFRRIRFHNREIDHVHLQTMYYEQLYNQSTDSICGYYITIKIHAQESLDFVVSKDFYIICPKFMLD